MAEKSKTFRPPWLPTALGSLPHTDIAAAWDTILTHFLQIPGWPQLPRRSYYENMYIQFSERFPGAVIEDGTIHVDRRQDLDRGLEDLYLAYLEDDIEHGAMSPTYAEGLAALGQREIDLPNNLVALRGQVTGPVSWGLTVVDQNRRPILYDEVLEDALGKHLRLKAAWQEQVLRQYAPETLIFIEEPYMASFGSSFVSLGRRQVIDLLEEVYAGLEGLRGVHCCGNTDWSILLSTSVDVLSLDAYDYSESLVRYAEDVSQFLDRGGVIAWGIVPAGIASRGETVDSLVERLHQALDALVEAGVSRDALLETGLITPSCSLGSLNPKLADHIFDLTVDVATEMQRRYVAAEQET